MSTPETTPRHQTMHFRDFVWGLGIVVVGYLFVNAFLSAF